MPVILHPDPMSASLLTSEPLVVSLEQQNYIKEILDICCSDSKFAEKAYYAIWRVLTGGSIVPPVVTSINPSTAALGSPSFTLHVMGTGFTSTSVIMWNGSEEPTIFVSASELTTEVDMSTAAVAIDIPVAVVTDGVMSDVVTFSLTEAGVQSASFGKTPSFEHAPASNRKAVTIREETESKK